MKLKLAHLYAKEMNLYGDLGNVITLYRRCQWRGIELQIVNLGFDDAPVFKEFDLLFFGGGEDRQQAGIGPDLLKKKANLQAAIADGLVSLTICGGYQLFGDYYRPVQGEVIPGIEVFPIQTESGTCRAIGNVIIRAELEPNKHLTMVGFENHSGKTHLEVQCKPLAQVNKGFGNNGADGSEGARHLNCFGSYLHGPLLSKNPGFADYLISLALYRKYGRVDLQPLDDTLENQTRTYVINRIKRIIKIFKG